MAKRAEEHMEAQRERIVRAMIACIADKGVERTSIADIRRKAGLSTGAIYVHFQGKEDIVAAVLRYGSMTEASLPDSWTDFVSTVTALDSQLGFDMRTIALLRLHVHAESVLPGRLHDAFRLLIDNFLKTLAERLQSFHDRGEISLRMSAGQTARAATSLIDGLLWIALSTDRSFEELKPDLMVGLMCLVDIGDAKGVTIE